MAEKLIEEAKKLYEEIKDYPSSVRKAVLEERKIGVKGIEVRNIDDKYIHILVKKYLIEKHLKWDIPTFNRLKRIAEEYGFEIEELGSGIFMLYEKRYKKSGKKYKEGKVLMCDNWGNIACKLDKPELLEKIIKEVYKVEV